jgi:Zn-dependent M28 family amino/carboxypeptidase
MRPLLTASAVAGLVALGLTACQREPAPAAEAPPPAAAAAASAPGPLVPTADGAWSPAITAEDFAARVQKLASDQFEGRKPGTVGERLTTAYLKDQFEQIGLKPGNAGSWFQTVPMVETTMVDADQVALDVKGSAGEARFAFGTDMVLGTLDGSLEVELKDSDVLFLGYGVDAPDQQWNDFDGVDVKGKTIVVLVNDPGWGSQDPELFKGRALTYYGRWTYKFEEAARKGAAAALIVHEDAGAGYPWGVVQAGWSGPQQSLPASEDPAPRLKAAGWLTGDAARRLFATAGQDFDALKKAADVRGFKPVALGAKLSTRFTNTVTRSTSENVLAVLPGSTRPDEVIVYTAHWDHLGKDEHLQGDQIYNGAVDNATGVAALLEIAEAFKHQQPAPERSILFLAVTLEESGLLGSAYYAAHPAYPLAKTVANINIDALPVIGRSKDVSVIGLGQSELDAYVTEAAKAQNRTITPDASPEKGFFFRSDHVNFARGGVPALYAAGGEDLVEGGTEAGARAEADYNTHRYHKPADEFDPNWDLRGTIEDLELLYAVGRRLGGESTFPQWKPGADFRRPQ